MADGRKEFLALVILQQGVRRSRPDGRAHSSLNKVCSFENTHHVVPRRPSQQTRTPNFPDLFLKVILQEQLDDSSHGAKYVAGWLSTQKLVLDRTGYEL